jgi:hypothetical protein
VARLTHLAATAAALLAILSLAPAAAAQPWGSQPPSDPPADEYDPPDEEPEPVAPVAPPPRSEPPAPPAPAPAPEDPSDNRPDGGSIGIGVGYSVPASILDPNLGSVRFRLASGLTFEPIVNLSAARSSIEVGGLESDVESTQITLATNVRIPLTGRGKVDLVLLGGAGVSLESVNPDGARNDTTRTSIAVAWGLGLDYWPKPRWCLSASAMNPLLFLVRTEEQGVVDDTTTTQVGAGAIFDPTLFVMLHLFL